MTASLAATAALLLAAMSGSAHLQPAPGPAADLSWMTGEWVQCGQGGAVTEEHWLGAGSSLVGVNWSRERSGQTSWEHLRIGTGAQGLTYFASPQGARATQFAAKTLQPGTAVFENPGHDFPKRITYRRTGDQLVAAATDLSGEGPTWTFRRKRVGACPAG